jgi:ABC-type multidrug transport system ATPase subunit
VNGREPDVHNKRHVAYLPEIDNLYGWMTVKETLRFISGFYKDWQEEKAAEMLVTMELDGDQKVRNLSKGLRARLKLIIALSRKVPLVLLDERFRELIQLRERKLFDPLSTNSNRMSKPFYYRPIRLRNRSPCLTK